MSCSAAEPGVAAAAGDVAVDPTALPEPVRQALVDRAVLRCVHAGYRRVAILGAGQHTRWMGTAPWSARGIEVAAFLDERPPAAFLFDVPVRRPDAMTEAVDAVVLSSDAHEARLADAAAATPALAGLPIVRIYDFPAPPAKTSTAEQPRRVRVGTAGELERFIAADHAKLNFGCGDEALPGWTNIDGGDGTWYDAPPDERVFALDVFRALAVLPDRCVDVIASEHFFEHFSLDDGHRLLAEWFRVLRPGGVLRITCPDLQREAKLFLGEIQPAPRDVIEQHRRRWLGDRYVLKPGERLTRAIVLNYGMWLDGHRFVYDLPTLRQSMTLAGFENITRCRFGESAHDTLRGIDRHDGGDTGRSWIPSMALVVEATRPAGDDDALPALATTVSTADGRDRAWWDRAYFAAGFRKHPSFLQHVDYEALESEGPEIRVAYQQIPAGALRRYPLEALAAERDLHMDMLRESGRRSDAHVARYELARRLVADGDVVLDASCGLGYGAAILAEGTGAQRVVGVDLSRYAVEYAEACYGVPGRIRFHLGDATDLGFLDDGAVDLVVSFETLEHLAEPERFLAEARRVLRPGGRLIASVPHDWTDETGRDPAPQHLHEYDWAKLERQVARHFQVETAWAQVAGGGMKLTDRPRRLRRVDPRATGVEAEWWIVTGRVAR
jgi:SAM-dependent methyltransferase